MERGSQRRLDEDPVRVSLPILNYILILLLGLCEVHRPDRIRGVPVLLS
jgi:hypothetical protein